MRKGRCHNGLWKSLQTAGKDRDKDLPAGLGRLGRVSFAPLELGCSFCDFTHSLRCGLYSFAASRLGAGMAGGFVIKSKITHLPQKGRQSWGRRLSIVTYVTDARCTSVESCELRQNRS